jgi:hypothetical protein
MLILKNCEQLIIGLKSLNPIKRMIRETKFTKCLIISEEQKYAKKINRIAKKTKMNVVAGNIETLHNLFDIQDFDLIITIGGEYVHSMINRLNNDNITHYAFETIAGKITSINNNKIPNIIFNPCSFSYDVSKGDIRY